MAVSHRVIFRASISIILRILESFAWYLVTTTLYLLVALSFTQRQGLSALVHFSYHVYRTWLETLITKYMKLAGDEQEIENEKI